MPKHGNVGRAQCVWLHATITLSPGMIFATFARIRSVVALVMPMTSSVAMAIFAFFFGKYNRPHFQRVEYGMRWVGVPNVPEAQGRVLA